jgi:hypothetical protein
LEGVLEDIAKRISIMIDDVIDKKLCLIQAKQIANSGRSVSYSQVLNEMIRCQLK